MFTIFVLNCLLDFHFYCWKVSLRNSIYEPETKTEDGAAGICFHLNSSPSESEKMKTFRARENISRRFINTRNKLKHNENNFSSTKSAARVRTLALPAPVASASKPLEKYLRIYFIVVWTKSYK